MKRAIWTALSILGFAAFGWGQRNGNSMLVVTEATVAGTSANSYTVLGATSQQEELVRSQIRVMQPEIFPLRIIFVPHWKYVVTAKALRRSAEVTHLCFLKVTHPKNRIRNRI